MTADDITHEIAVTIDTLIWELRRFGEQQVGLTPLPQSEFDVLRAVFDRPGATVSDIARRLSRQPSNISTSVRRLVERGLLEREIDPRDRRSGLLRPTEQARLDRRAIDTAWDSAVGRVLETMTDDEVRTMVAAVPLLRRMTDLPHR
ncbi:MarR family transcriptional regulator [Rhodococcoides trifolii]|uniref:MarR family transcriptional regulator n=1 Tax=Rhodococcoides trifolii TaxID=908250 RepID=A0A917CZ42_9NOCA|nr:MarR family transcriptional regulator [Rhodococcus trifolii]GGG02473.1 MarR family transcriptional regulator [Rhodococcus trifolii]